MRGSDFVSYEPDLDFSGNLPPRGEVRVVIELVPNFNELDPRTYARRDHFTAHAPASSEVDLIVAGQPAFAATIHQNQPDPWPSDSRYWFVRSPYFRDRMLVIQASPADARVRDVDAIVASLRFAAPVAAPVTPITRAQVTAKYATPGFPVQRVDRVEAKLATWKEYELADGTFHSGTNDPEQLVWLVLVTGEVVHPRGGPPSAARSAPPTPPTYPSILFVIDAASGDQFGLSCCGPDARPKWFDGLADRAK
jgi:hypothetical protein